MDERCILTWLEESEFSSISRSRGSRQASPNFIGLTSLENEYFCYLLYSVFLFNAILGLDFLGLALSRPLLEATEPH